jgi:iron complex outermembrane receptor protein
MRRVWAVFFAMLFGVASIHFSCLISFAQAPQGQAVTVAVKDPKGGTVDNAVVVLSMGTSERRGTTAVDGTVRFANIEAGNWALEVRREGFSVAQQQATVGAAPVSLDVTLSLQGLSQSVSVEAKLDTLDTTASSATRLELSLRETPATLSVVTQERIQERGATTASEAIELAGGTFISQGLGGQLPGYSTRGFTGNSVMTDGIRQNSTVQSARPMDSFLLERVEVLKGPASLFAGEGGTAGTVNYVSKTPKSEFGTDSFLSYGSFAARRVGLGVTGPITDRILARVDAVFSDGGGFAKPAYTRTRAMSGNVWWLASRNVTFRLSGKYTDDQVGAYYATPFIDGKVDPRMRYKNYNMKDAFSRGHNNFGRLDTEISLPNGWRLHNGTFAATQRLDYRNMESYTYNTATNLVDVSTYFLIWRDDILVGNQTDLRKTIDVFGRSVNFVTGFELQRNDMHRARNPLNSGTVRFSLDPFNPVLPSDPNLQYRRMPDVLVNNKTAYAEAQVKLAPSWSAVLGVRAEQIGVDYGIAVGDPTTKHRNFYPVTGRAGLVFTATEDVSIYGSFSRSVEPATQFVSLSGCCGSSTFFDLTPGRQFEVGAKGSALNGRVEGTVSYFDVAKTNIPTKTLVDGVSIDQLVGGQNSKGVEVAFTGRVTSNFNVVGDFTYTRGRFSDFGEVVGTTVVSRDGNVPTNIPVIIWSLTPTQRIGPVTIAASVRQFGGRWANTANTLHLPTYQTLDAWVSFQLPRSMRLTLRGRNLTDELYIPSASSTSGRLGAPRSYEMSLASSF